MGWPAERKLDKATATARATTSSKEPGRLQLHYEDDEDDQLGDDMAGVQAEQEEEEGRPDDSETACLLYEAEQELQRTRQESVDSHASPRTRSRSNSPAPNHLDQLDQEYAPSTQGTPTAYTRRGQSVGPPASSRIHFSDLVRISGGIRSSAEKARRNRSRERRSVSPFASSAAAMGRRSSLGSVSSSPPVSSPLVPGGRTRSSLSGPSSTSESASSEVPVLYQPTPRRPTSRPASFRSEVSRASTPASLYAPLLQPSATAPSPTRPFYLTLGKREDGEISYREMVKRQTRQRRSKGKNVHERSALLDGRAGKRKRGAWSWLCCCFARSRGQDEESDSASSSEADSDSDVGLEARQRPRSRPAHKSEMQVLFGSAPWRWFRGSYWRYRLRRGDGTGLDDEEEEEGGGGGYGRYIDGSRVR